MDFLSPLSLIEIKCSPVSFGNICCNLVVRHWTCHLHTTLILGSQQVSGIISLLFHFWLSKRLVQVASQVEYWSNTTCYTSAGMTPFKGVYGCEPPNYRNMSLRIMIHLLCKNNCWQEMLSCKNWNWIYNELNGFKRSMRIWNDKMCTLRWVTWCWSNFNCIDNIHWPWGKIWNSAWDIWVPLKSCSE